MIVLVWSRVIKISRRSWRTGHKGNAEVIKQVTKCSSLNTNFAEKRPMKRHSFFPHPCNLWTIYSHSKQVYWKTITVEDSGVCYNHFTNMMSHCITELVLPQVSKHVVALNIPDVGESPIGQEDAEVIKQVSKCSFSEWQFLLQRKLTKSYAQLKVHRSTSELGFLTKYTISCIQHLDKCTNSL